MTSAETTRSVWNRWRHGNRKFWALLAAGQICCLPTAIAQASPTPSCDDLSPLFAPALTTRRLQLVEGHPETITLALPAGHAVLLAASQQGINAQLVVGNQVADTPTPRAGTLYVKTLMPGNGLLSAVLKRHASGGHRGNITLCAYDVGSQSTDTLVRSFVDAVTSAEATYAKGRIDSDTGAGEPGSATDLYRQAEAQFNQTFNTVQALNQSGLQAQIAEANANLDFFVFKQWAAAANWAGQAESLYQRVGADAAAARMRSVKLSALESVAESAPTATPTAGKAPDGARFGELPRQLDNAAHLNLRHGQPFYSILALMNEGDIFSTLEKDTAAEHAFLAARRIASGTQDRDRIAATLERIGLLKIKPRHYIAARRDFLQAIQLLADEPLSDMRGTVLSDLATLEYMTGDLDHALGHYQEALVVLRRNQQLIDEWEALRGLANVYGDAGEHTMRRVYLDQSLEVAKSAGSVFERAGSLAMLAALDLKEGHLQQALNEATEANPNLWNNNWRVRTLLFIFEANFRLGHAAAATAALTQAGELAAKADKVTRGHFQMAQARALASQHQFPQARLQSDAALAAFNAPGLIWLRFHALMERTQIESDAGQIDTALIWSDRTLDAAEHLRVTASSAELRTGLMNEIRPAYDLALELLASKYTEAQRAHDVHAMSALARRSLMVAEQSRARAVADYAQMPASDELDAKTARALERRGAALREAANYQGQLQSLRDSRGSEATAVALQRKVAALRAQIADLDTRMATRRAAARQFRAPPTQVMTALEQLPKDQALVAYWLTSAHVFAWVVSGGEIHWLQLQGAADIQPLAMKVHNGYRNLRTANPEDRAASSVALSQRVLWPVLAQLPAGVRRLIVIPDGALHYVSFAALPASQAHPQDFLVQNFDIAYAAGSSATLRDNTPRPAPDNRMLLVDDAVYTDDDQRLSRPRSASSTTSSMASRVSASASARPESNRVRFARLPATATEADAVAHHMGAIKVERLEGLAASRAQVLSPAFEHSAYLHLAVHGTTDSAVPQLSSLVLSGFDASGRTIDDRILAGDLLTRRLRARSVVLSACDTALGREEVGEGLVGLRYMFLVRGADSVVASLWSVPDAATAQLMQEYYAGLIDRHQRPDTALAAAMRRMIAAGKSDPALWGAFTASLARVSDAASMHPDIVAHANTAQRTLASR